MKSSPVPTRTPARVTALAGALLLALSLGGSGLAVAAPATAATATAAAAAAAPAKPDSIRPKVSIAAPASSKVRAWRRISGTATDAGGSDLRYVVVTAFQLRHGDWYGLTGNGSQTRWKRFASRVDARYGATERTSVLTSPDLWRISLPRVRAGRLVVIAKAADFAANERSKQVVRAIG